MRRSALCGYERGAAAYASAETVRVLLADGADARALDDTKRTPLRCACGRSDAAGAAVVALLLEAAPELIPRWL